MAIKHFGQDIVRDREVAELVLKIVAPLCTVKEVVAIAKDNDEDRGHDAARVVIAAIDHGIDDRLAVGLRKFR